MTHTTITVAELEEGMETPRGIITDLVPNMGSIDVYVDDAWVGTVPPSTRIRVYA